MRGWPATRDELLEAQRVLGEAEPPLWDAGELSSIGGCFVCFARGQAGRGKAGDRGWAAAATVRKARAVAGVAVEGTAGAAYEAGLLALREGALLDAAVRALPDRPPVVLVDATGRDHPRRAGLAVHLGAVLDVPTVGITHRPLCAHGGWPEDEAGAATPLRLGSDVVGYWLRTRAGTRPLAIHAGWRTDASTALEVARVATTDARTPAPLREARRLARTARAGQVSVPAEREGTSP